MKYTQMLLCLALFFLLSVKSVGAVTISNIRIVTIAPTATPTPIIVKKMDANINLKLIPTIEPAAKSTVTPTPTLETKLTATPEPTLETKLTVTPEQKVSNEEKTKNEFDLKSLFIKITLGLLAAIIVIQIWPKKKEN